MSGFFGPLGSWSPRVTSQVWRARPKVDFVPPLEAGRFYKIALWCVGSFGLQLLEARVGADQHNVLLQIAITGSCEHYVNTCEYVSSTEVLLPGLGGICEQSLGFGLRTHGF